MKTKWQVISWEVFQKDVVVGTYDTQEDAERCAQVLRAKYPLDWFEYGREGYDVRRVEV